MGLAVLREAALPATIPEERRERILRAGRAAAYHVADPKSDTAGYEDWVAHYPKETNIHYAYGIFRRKRAAMAPQKGPWGSEVVVGGATGV